MKHAGNFSDIYASKVGAFNDLPASHLLSVEADTDDSELEGATFLHQEDSGDRRRLSRACAELLVLPIPQRNDDDLILHLWKIAVFAAGPNVRYTSGRRSNISQCCHYAGVVKDNPDDSLAEISICQGEIAGIVQ